MWLTHCDDMISREGIYDILKVSSIRNHDKKYYYKIDVKLFILYCAACCGWLTVSYSWRMMHLNMFICMLCCMCVCVMYLCTSATNKFALYSGLSSFHKECFAPLLARIEPGASSFRSSWGGIFNISQNLTI